MVQEIFIRNREHSCSQLLHDGDKKLNVGNFMEIFKDIFVPWCLQGNNFTTNARLDLLLALLDDEYFSEQWAFIVNFATRQTYSGCSPGLLDADSATILAILLEKARVEITKRKIKENSRDRQGTDTDLWHHERLESAAIAVSRSLPPFNNAHVQFVWYVNLIYQRHNALGFRTHLMPLNENECCDCYFFFSPNTKRLQ